LKIHKLPMQPTRGTQTSKWEKKKQNWKVGWEKLNFVSSLSSICGTSSDCFWRLFICSYRLFNTRRDEFPGENLDVTLRIYLMKVVIYIR